MRLIPSFSIALTAVLFGALLPSAQGASPAQVASTVVGKPLFKSDPLQSDQLQVVRSIGRAVLVAKKGEVSDPELTALYQELRALSGALDEAVFAAQKPMALPDAERKPTVVPSVPESVAIVHSAHYTVSQDGRVVSDEAAVTSSASVPLVGAGNASTPVGATAISPNLASKEFGAMDKVFGQVRQHLAKTDSLLQRYVGAARQRGGAHREIQVQAVASKVGHIESELSSALDGLQLANGDTGGSSETSMAVLKNLQERLRDQGANGLGRGVTDAPPTPTIRTLSHSIQH